MEEALDQSKRSIKAAVKLFDNSGTTMSPVRKFEEKVVQTGCQRC